MSSSVILRHNFETAHRLPFMEGKCTSLHGHSWWVEVTIRTPEETSVVVEFGLFKSMLRGWIDRHLDHGTMLGHKDPLATILPEFGKVFIFGPDQHEWPTVENVARLLAVKSQELLETMPRSANAQVVHVKVSETHVNAAEWTLERPF